MLLRTLRLDFVTQDIKVGLCLLKDLSGIKDNTITVVLNSVVLVEYLIIMICVNFKLFVKVVKLTVEARKPCRLLKDYDDDFATNQR